LVKKLQTAGKLHVRCSVHDLRHHAENLIMPSKEAESIHHFV